MKQFKIGGRLIGEGAPCAFVAELSGNHNGSLSRALELIRVASEAGADAIKLQTYTADTITIDAPGPWYEISEGPWRGRRLHELYAEASTPWEWHRELFMAAKAHNLPCFSTPFDPTAVDFLEQLDCPAYKIASFEVVDIPLLRHVGATRKPVIMSTGMASLAEISLAVQVLRESGTSDLCLLTCVSAYPADAADMHLANIQALSQSFGCCSGLSDHSLKATALVAATALGAAVIEKHICLARSDGGPDAGFSLEPHELGEQISAMRATESALAGGVCFGPGQSDAGNVIFRKSLIAVRDIVAGATVVSEDVRSLRPGHGIPPFYLPQVIGRRAACHIARGTPMAWNLLS